MDENPLGLDPETMRRLGYQTVDLLVDRLAGLGDEPVMSRGTPAELARRLSGPLQPARSASRTFWSSSSPTSCRSSAATITPGSDDIGPGDFFGEIAALDWGASFGYARLATVTATSPMRLLVLTSAGLLPLLNDMPHISAQVRGAMRDRLPGL